MMALLVPTADIISAFITLVPGLGRKKRVRENYLSY